VSVNTRKKTKVESARCEKQLCRHRAAYLVVVYVSKCLWYGANTCEPEVVLDWELILLAS
jgi:hypothetical protein